MRIDPNHQLPSSALQQGSPSRVPKELEPPRNLHAPGVVVLLLVEHHFALRFGQ